MYLGFRQITNFRLKAELRTFKEKCVYAVAIIAPIGLRFAHNHADSPLLMGLMVIHGAQAGGFSPISIYGGITNRLVERAGLPRGEITLFLSSLAFNFLLALLLFFVFGGHRSAQSGGATSKARDLNPSGDSMAKEDAVVSANPLGDTEPGSGPSSLGAHQALTLIGIVALAVGSLVFELNVGLLAMSVAVLLALLSPRAQKNAVDQVSWSTVLLITGVVTYVEVLQRVGAVDLAGVSVSNFGVPLLAALILCYIGGGVSAFASSVAVLGGTIPLAIPFLLHGHISAVGVVAAIAVSTTIVDVSPFSTNGAIVVAKRSWDR